MYWICVETSQWCSPLPNYRNSSLLLTEHLPSDVRTATGVPQQSSRSSQPSALSLDNHLDVLRHFLCANCSVITFTNMVVQHKILRLDSSHRIVGFSDSRILPSPLIEQSNHYFACCWHCCFLYGSLGPFPGCVLHGSLGPTPGCFLHGSMGPSLAVFFLHVHLARVSSNLLLTPWLGASLAFLPSRRQLQSGLWDSALRCSEHALLNPSLALLRALGFAPRVTRPCFSLWPTGCVTSLHSLLRRRLLMPVSSLWRQFLVFARASPALVCFFSPDCEFLVVIVHLVLLSRCSVRDFSSGLFLQLHLVVVYSDVACQWSLQHCCTVLCYGVVAGPVPVR